MLAHCGVPTKVFRELLRTQLELSELVSGYTTSMMS